MKKILIVDDVSTNLKCCNIILKDKYQPVLAKSGQEALQYLQKEVPDLILLDIHMPDIDGYEVMEQIKKDEKTTGIPVIFVTAETKPEYEARGRAMGAADYIRKPFSTKKLLDSVEKVLGSAG